ncbi:hypothetical protein [Ancylomarina sp. 16SWW S1-10-2]|uniref:hypothetical protein n=1 Tax=Ancylomarina sp. 16SWW S1-10-2 TaxID=2499681 RepID=UPI0012AD999F|nr:hypothetical protein [Ancylomarina sp. 16SWW S1-10-2]MRT92234.1 hypothetical protein [Ancylomarina sp. 16SWW S1-10-2]
MIGEQTHNHSIQVQDFSLEKNQTVKRILIFIKNTLPEFESVFKKSEITFNLEDDISKELSHFFNDKARSENLLFQFNEKKGVDFTIFTFPFTMGASSIFMIEAKRLSKKHYDYVSGRTGGIERIKKEQDEFGKHLNQGAMIAYIQDNDLNYWENRINSWIEDLIKKDTDIEWQKNDLLIVNNQFSNYTSMHSRVSKEAITLYHYWISVN